jgi:polyisoprenoid-binding protein YceI
MISLMIKNISFIILFLLIYSMASGQTWTLNKADSKLGFDVNSFMIASVDGAFNDFTSTFHSSKEDFTDAEVKLSIETKSISTGNKKRDNHLRSDDYFEVDKYPAMTFKSTDIKKVGDRKYRLSGNLTLHGVTKSISVDVALISLSNDKKEVVFEISSKLKRSDFNFGKGAMEATMGDDVKISGKVKYRKE